MSTLLKLAEAVDRHMKVMVSNAGADQVNVVSGNKRSARSRLCYASGLDGHLAETRGVLHVVKHVEDVVVLGISELGVLKLCEAVEI